MVEERPTSSCRICLSNSPEKKHRTTVEVVFVSRCLGKGTGRFFVSRCFCLEMFFVSWKWDVI